MRIFFLYILYFAFVNTPNALAVKLAATPTPLSAAECALRYGGMASSPNIATAHRDRSQNLIALAERARNNPKITDEEITQAVLTMARDTWHDIERLSQEDLRTLLEQHIERMYANEGYIRGLTLRNHGDVRNLDQMLDDLLHGNRLLFRQAWSNILTSPNSTADMIPILRAHSDLREDLIPFTNEVVDAAIWERVRRLLVSGQWTLFRNEELRRQYQARAASGNLNAQSLNLELSGGIFP